MTSIGKQISRSVGKRLGKRMGRSTGLAPGTQLLSFTGSGAVFTRNNGNGGTDIAGYRPTDTTLADAAADVIRVESLSSVNRYLFERYMVNEIAASDNPSAWTVTTWTATANTTDVLDPFGTNTATKIVTGTNAAAAFSRSLGTSSIENGVTVTFSIWLRGAAGGEQLRLRARDAANTFAETAITLTTSWVRYSITRSTGTGATASGWFVQNKASGAVNSTFYASRGQVERGAYPSSGTKSTASIGTRYADSLSWASDEVPQAFRAGAWTCNVRPTWANADLSDGELRVVAAMTTSDYVAFEKSSGSLYLRYYSGGTLRFGTGAITVARDTDYLIIVNPVAGIMTFNGTPGSAGTTGVSWPAGNSLRWGGLVANSNSELDGGCSVAVSA